MTFLTTVFFAVAFVVLGVAFVVLGVAFVVLGVADANTVLLIVAIIIVIWLNVFIIVYLKLIFNFFYIK